MPLEHLLKHVVLAPLGAAVVLLLVFRVLARRRKLPVVVEPVLVFVIAVLVGLWSNPNWSLSLWPQSDEEWLGVGLIAAAFAEASRWIAQGWPWQLRPALAVILTWQLATPVRDYFGWGTFTFYGMLILIALLWSLFIVLARDASRRLPQPAFLLIMLLQGTALALLCVASEYATAAEAAGTACSAIGVLLAAHWWRPNAFDLRGLCGPWVMFLAFLSLNGRFYVDMPILSTFLVLLAPAVVFLPRPSYDRPRYHAIIAGAYALLFLLPALWIGGVFS